MGRVRLLGARLADRRAAVQLNAGLVLTCAQPMSRELRSMRKTMRFKTSAATSGIGQERVPVSVRLPCPRRSYGVSAFIATRTVEADEPVGYGATFIAKRPY